MNDHLPDPERFQAIHACSLDGIALVRNVRDAFGSIIDFTCEYLNPVAERLVGQPLAQLYGQRMSKVFPGAAENGLLARYFAVAAGGESQIFEQAYAADGLNAWYRNMVVRIEDGLAISFSDITAQKQTEIALRASEDRFRQFAATVRDIFWIADLERQQLLYLSPAYDQIVGRNRINFYANFMEWSAIIHPDDRERISSAFSARSDAEMYEQEFRIVRPDGSVRWLRDRSFQIWDTARQTHHVAGISEDITERKTQAAQIALQARMLDAVGQAVVATDMDGRIRYWNRAAELLYGWTSAEALGRDMADTLGIAPNVAIQREMLAALTSGNVWSGELSVYHRDGSPLDVLVTDSPVYDTQGNPLGIIGVSVDITQRKRTELERTQLLTFTTALAEALTPTQVAAGIFKHVHLALEAHAGTVALLVEETHTLEVLGTLGYPPELMAQHQHLALDMALPLVEAARSGQPVWLETPAELAARYPQLLELMPETGANASFPLIIQQRIIGALSLSFAGPRLFSANNRVYLQMIAQQCAQALDRAWLYEAERRAHLAATEAVQMRDEFIAMISHDLRNPLTVIRGQARLMLKQVEGLDDLGQKLASRLTVIHEMVSQMDGQIDDLLDGAHLRAGYALALNRQSVDLVALVRQSVVTIQSTSARHSIQLTAPDTVLLCMGDSRRLARIFANLLRNAIIYSPNGDLINVTVAREGDTTAVVSVQDSGIGIPPTDLPRIFERFYRGTNAVERVRGTGLGLANARQIIEQHEGRISVVSVEGRGSTFTVRLPCAAEGEHI